MQKLIAGGLLTLGVQLAFSCAPQPARPVEPSTDNSTPTHGGDAPAIEEKPFTEIEEKFLDCAMPCFAQKTEAEFNGCLARCREQAPVADEVVARFQNDDADPGKPCRGTNFHCPWDGTPCCCSGYFDCKALSQRCCKEPIDSCGKTGDGPEVCTCKSKCGLSAAPI